MLAQLQTPSCPGTPKACHRSRSHSLPLQQVQILLTLFPKFFSPFPHGTCSLTVSSFYLALDGIDHPLGAPVSRNVTHQGCAVRAGLEVMNGTFTLSGAPFLKAHTLACYGNPSQLHNSRPRGPDFQAKLPPIRSPLLGHTILCLVLRLLICLNSAGVLIQHHLLRVRASE